MIGLRLQPRDFWCLSLHEWFWLTAPVATGSLDRQGLMTLMAQYPDRHDQMDGNAVHHQGSRS
ncbi:MAG: phage tail assembly chaperone [Pseudomonadota bacterium]